MANCMTVEVLDPVTNMTSITTSCDNSTDMETTTSYLKLYLVVCSIVKLYHSDPDSGITPTTHISTKICLCNLAKYIAHAPGSTQVVVVENVLIAIGFQLQFRAAAVPMQGVIATDSSCVADLDIE